MCSGNECLREFDCCCPQFDSPLVAFLLNHSVRHRRNRIQNQSSKSPSAKIRRNSKASGCRWSPKTTTPYPKHNAENNAFRAHIDEVELHVSLDLKRCFTKMNNASNPLHSYSVFVFLFVALAAPNAHDTRPFGERLEFLCSHPIAASIWVIAAIAERPNIHGI